MRSLWRRKTANIFRGVLEVECSGLNAEQSEVLVRDLVLGEFSPGFFVPFAFGAVLHYSQKAPSPEDLQGLIDDRAQAKGTWQWVIAVDEAAGRAFGVHTWTNGYLTPVYESLLKHYERVGLISSTRTKPPGKFFTRLWRIGAGLATARKYVILAGAGLVVALLLAQLLVESNAS